MMLVGKWLKGIGLDYAVPTFEAAGIVTAEALSELDPMVHFESLGVTRPDDRRKLFFLVQRVKQAQKSEKKENSVEIKAAAAKEDAAATITASAADDANKNKKASTKQRTTTAKASAALAAAAQPLDSSAGSSKLVKPKNAPIATTNGSSSSSVAVPAAAVAGQQSHTGRASQQATRKLGSSEEDLPRRSDADGAHIAARHGNEEESGEAHLRFAPSASYDDDDDDSDLPRRRTSTSSTSNSRRLSGMPLPSKRRTSGQKPAETTSTTASDLISTRTGKALSSIPSESAAPMSPLVQISLAADDDRREICERGIDLPARAKLSRGMGGGQVTQRTARRASSLRSRSEEEHSSHTSANHHSSAVPHRPAAAKSANHNHNNRLSRAQSLQNGHHDSAPDDSPPASSNPFAAQIERLREQNAGTSGSTNTQSFRIDPTQRVSVVVRKRPASHDVDMLQVLPPNRLLVYQPRTRVDLRREIATTSFRFDAVVDEVTNNAAVYENVVRPLIPNLARGQNSTVFCFGQTNSGKTHTLLGRTITVPRNEDDDGYASDHGDDAPSLVRKVTEPGLYYLAAVDIFDMLSEMEGLSVAVTLLELYDRKVLDLLNDRASVPCWEDGAGKVQFPGLSLHPVASAEQLQRLIEQGHALRSIGTTSKNSESSRSHAVLQLHINQAEKRKHRRYATMTFIDLGTSPWELSIVFFCRRIVVHSDLIS
jgi:Kinesin motor domain/SAM domain (Sterile alpha motif)